GQTVSSLRARRTLETVPSMKEYGRGPALQPSRFLRDRTRTSRTRAGLAGPGGARWHPGIACEKRLHRPRKRMPDAAFATRLRRRSAPPAQRRALERLQYVRHQGARKLARKPLKRGRVFFEKAAQLLRDLILLAKHIRRILVQRLPLLVGEGYAHADNYKHASGTAGL